ncbi:MAG: GNAT family N-acetyltransferase [Thermodesulfobacteriota bacterium]
MAKRRSKLTVPNDPRYLKGIISYCEEISLMAGFSKKEIKEITTALKEACMNVVTHAFNPYEDESFEITFEIERDGLKIAIGDMGLPFSSGLVKKNKETPGMKAIEANIDEVLYINRGKEGKELQLFKYLKGRHVEEIFTEEELKPYGVCQIPSKEKKLSIRLMNPEEAVQVSKCIYRAYKYTYLKEDLYFPERIASMNKRGDMISAVTVTDGGEVVGHFAILPRPNKKVAEIGVAVVVPEYRGRGLMKKMLDFLLEEGRQRSLTALYGNAFTIHALSQRTNLGFGFHETALELGWVPPGSMKVMVDRGLKGAGNILTFFKYLRESSGHAVFLPPRHRTMLEKIYSGMGVKRSFENPYFISSENNPWESTIHLSIKPFHKSAVIEVKQYGQDLVRRIKAKMVELEKKGFNAIFIDLELKDPFTPEATAWIEDLGFFFSGLLPDFSEGDVLRLQYYNTAIEYDEIHTSSIFAAELVDYIKSLDSRWRALQSR